MKLPAVIQKYRIWIIVMALVGMLLASYLYYEYASQETFGVCNINATFNCDPVVKGKLALFYGVPVSLIGFAGYAAIFLSALLKKFKWSLGFTIFGILFCLRLLFLEIFVEQVLCLICIACMAVMVTELFLTYRAAYPEKMGLLDKSPGSSVKE